MTKLPLFLTLSAIILSACSSGPTPLPKGGPTTGQIWHGDTRTTGEQSNQQLSSEHYRKRSNTITAPTTMSARTTAKLQDFNQDFKRVPNPQIIGYVAPHFNQAQMPVPGYFTVFKLYKKDGYALIDEDAATGESR